MGIGTMLIYIGAATVGGSLGSLIVMLAFSEMAKRRGTRSAFEQRAQEIKSKRQQELEETMRAEARREVRGPRTISEGSAPASRRSTARMKGRRMQ